MNDVQGINIEEMKNMSKIFFEYRDNISRLFSEYKRIIDNSKAYFNGDVATLYRDKFNELYEKLEIVVNSFNEYGESIENVIKKYGTADTTFKEINKKIEKQVRVTEIK